MGSSLIVDVCQVLEVYPHPNADALEFIKLKGWPVIVQKSIGLKVGDKVVYFPPDTVMSEELANKLEILKYLSPWKDEEGKIKGYRVRAARLRGEPSYGTIDHEVPEGFDVGDDLKEHFGIIKFEPPLKAMDGDAETPMATFVRYTDIENIRNFPDILQEGEEVALTEKLHGKNLRNGLLRDTDENGNPTYIFVGGSHDVRRKEFDQKGKLSDFWLPLHQDPNMKTMLQDLSGGTRDVIVFSELIGSGVQDMAYGFKNGGKGYRSYDIYVAGHYLDVQDKIDIFQKYSIPSVPILYRGPFSWALMEEHTYGPTTMCPADDAGKFKGREGIVITPIKGRRDYALSGESKRVIFKSISADYVARKGGTEDH